MEREKRKKNKTHGFIYFFFHHRYGIAGLCGTLVFVILAFCAPFFGASPSGYGEISEIQLAPCSNHLFGTDAMGLDVLSEVLWGARTSIKLGVMVVLYATVIGVIIGLISGYFKGVVGEFLMAATDLFLTIPMLPLMIMMAAIMGPSVSNVSIIIGVFSWPRIAKVTRASTLEVMGMKYIEAEKCLGIPTLVIIGKHILLYSSSFILSEMTLLMASAILTESGISFLGLGDSDVWSWGKILQNAQINGIFFRAWWCSLFPSLFILFFVISFSFLSMGMKDSIKCHTKRN